MEITDNTFIKKNPKSAAHLITIIYVNYVTWAIYLVQLNV